MQWWFPFGLGMTASAERAHGATGMLRVEQRSRKEVDIQHPISFLSQWRQVDGSEQTPEPYCSNALNMRRSPQESFSTCIELYHPLFRMVLRASSNQSRSERNGIWAIYLRLAGYFVILLCLYLYADGFADWASDFTGIANVCSV